MASFGRPFKTFLSTPNFAWFDAGLESSDAFRSHASRAAGQPNEYVSGVPRFGYLRETKGKPSIGIPHFWRPSGIKVPSFFPSFTHHPGQTYIKDPGTHTPWLPPARSNISAARRCASAPQATLHSATLWQSSKADILGKGGCQSKPTPVSCPLLPVVTKTIVDTTLTHDPEFMNLFR